MTTLYHPRPERWPQYTLRGLLVVLTLAGLLIPVVRIEYLAWQKQPRVITNIRAATGMDSYVFKYSTATAEDASALP